MAKVTQVQAQLVEEKGRIVKTFEAQIKQSENLYSLQI